MRITAYADRLADDLDGVDWPEKVKLMQRNWIGRSKGARITFPVVTGTGEEDGIDVFTTRADTIFGATFMVIAPEHPLVDKLAAGTEQEEAVREYVKHTAGRSAEERATKEKDGVFTGRYAANPATGEKIPLWVADYVLMEYGTGAIMAVPAHDERDFEFAQRYGLPVARVVEPADGSSDESVGPFAEHTENERLVNSAEFSG